MEDYFAPSHLWLLHSPLSADALPQATSPNYLALGLAIRDAPAVAFPVASERTEGVSPRDTVPWRMVCRSLMIWTTDRLLEGKLASSFFELSQTVKSWVSPIAKALVPVEVMRMQLLLVVKCDRHGLQYPGYGPHLGRVLHTYSEMCLFLSLYTCYGISIPGSDYIIIFEHRPCCLFVF